MLIRVEIPVDAQPVAQLLNRAFPSPAEAELVQALREAGQLTLSLVAVDDEGQCIGYLAFSPLLLDGNDYQWVALAPLAVDPAYQGQGIGQALVQEGLNSLNEFGYAAAVVLGDPRYYARFGFAPVSADVAPCPWLEYQSAFQLLKLDSFQAPQAPVQAVNYAEPFSHL